MPSTHPLFPAPKAPSKSRKIEGRGNRQKAASREEQPKARNLEALDPAEKIDPAGIVTLAGRDPGGNPGINIIVLRYIHT
jgi:hypothetical protein